MKGCGREPVGERGVSTPCIACNMALQFSRLPEHVLSLAKP